VGTQKRERQKANRAVKRTQETKAATRAKTKQRATRLGLLAVIGVAIVVVIAWIGGAFSSDEAAPTTTVEVGEPVITDPVPDTECPPSDGAAEQRREFAAAPPMCIDPEASYTAVVETNFGEFSVELDAAQAPMTVNNFVVLARYGYFDDTICHRILPGFVIQCGDPTGTGTGGPGYAIPDELPEAGAYELGSLAMANSGPNTSGSQFFVITGPAGESLPPQYSLFGQVTAGLDDTIVEIDQVGNPDPASNGIPPLQEVRIERITIIEA